MPSINLIAARRAEKHRLQQHIRKLIYALAAEAGVVLFIVSVLTLQLVNAQSHVGDLDTRIAKLKPQVDRIQQLEGETSQLQPKLTALNTARGTTLYWYTALQNVTSSLSTNAWLTELSTTGSPSAAAAPKGPGAAPAVGAPIQAATINLNGVAVSQAEVGQTMLKMNQYPHFDQVQLNYATQALIGKKPTVNFQLTVLLHPTDDGAALGKGKGDGNVQKS